MPAEPSPLSGAAAEWLFAQRLQKMGELNAGQQALANQVLAKLRRDPGALQKHLKERGVDEDTIMQLNALLQGSQPGNVKDLKALEDRLRTWAPLLRGVTPPNAKSPSEAPNEDHMRSALLKQFQDAARAKQGGGPRSNGGPSASRPDQPGTAQKAPEPPPRGPEPPDAQQQEFMAKLARRFGQWAENSRLASTLSQSPAWQRMMRGLDRYREGEGWFGPRGGEGSFFRKWGLESGLGKLFSGDTWRFRTQIPRPSLPSVSRWLPSVSHPDVTPAVGRPRFSGSSADLWRGLLWVVLGIILGLVVWRVLAAKQRAASAARGERPGQTLGPWPVAPDLVRTRGELIQAFEYLSLLLLGSRARSWHHQQIAVSLAVPETQQDRREAVLDLAALYETARYAPPTQPVPEQDLARARCHLCFLAGVSAT